MNSGTQGYRRWALVFLLVILSIETSFSCSSTEREPRPITDATTTSDQAQHTSYSSLRYRRREVATADEAQRRSAKVRMIGGTDTLSSRIVDGTDASSFAYPYFILWGGCGATLIHNDIALSAAHCTRQEDAQVGPRNRSDASNTSTRVVQVRNHPQYDLQSFDYDFAILKLNGWFQSEKVRLNYEEDRPGVGESLRLLGFGGQSLTLKQGKVEAISSSICAYQWQRAGYLIDESAVICANSDEGVNPCTGDSGGPLLSSSNVQVGVISSGSDCDGRLPSVYSRVSAAKDWIKSQICELSDFPPADCPGQFNRKPLGTETVRVDIHLDEYPQDIRWRITSNVGDERTTEIASGGDFEVPNSLESRFVDLQSGSYYDFTIEDLSGFADGLGSNGRYKVVTVNSEGNDKDTLVSGGGNFQQSESVTFPIGNVPEPTLPPIVRPIVFFPASTLEETKINSEILTKSPVAPTYFPISTPTQSPTLNPTTRVSTPKPIVIPPPSLEPTNPTLEPSISAIPLDRQSDVPTKERMMPTDQPVSSSKPTPKPTDVFTLEPTLKLTEQPTIELTALPTKDPTMNPTDTPTKRQTSEPTGEPTNRPTKQPTTLSPTKVPTNEPTTLSPTKVPTNEPTTSPTEVPAINPTFDPTVDPTEKPTEALTVEPTSSPTEKPTVELTANPTSVTTPELTEVENLDDDFKTALDDDNNIDDDGFDRRSLQGVKAAASDQSSSTLSSSPFLVQSLSEPTDISRIPTSPPSDHSSVSFRPTVSFFPTSSRIPSRSSTPPDNHIDTPSVSPTTKSLTGNPTNIPSDNPIDNPAVSPIIKSLADNLTDVPPDNPIDNLSVSPTTESPTDNPAQVLSGNPTGIVDPTTEYPTDDPVGNPSASPTIKSPTGKPTDVASKSPTDNLPASPTTESPIGLTATGTPTELPSNTNAVLPTEAPTTAQPIPSPSANSTDAPVILVRKYIGFVNISIFEDPEKVSWRIVDALSQEQFYGYPAGNYKETTTSMNFLNIETGIWEFQLTRESVATDTRAEVGTLNLITGEIELLGDLAFAPSSTATVVSTLIILK